MTRNAATSLRLPAAVALAVLLLPACGVRTRYPITQQARPFSDLNEARAGSAPPVAQGVTSERIARARAEPQNWLTYYGAYDGQRFSSLDQINAGNVARLRPAWVFQTGVIGLVVTALALRSRHYHQLSGRYAEAPEPVAAEVAASL